MRMGYYAGRMVQDEVTAGLMIDEKARTAQLANKLSRLHAAETGHLGGNGQGDGLNYLVDRNGKNFAAFLEAGTIGLNRILHHGLGLFQGLALRNAAGKRRDAGDVSALFGDFENGGEADSLIGRDIQFNRRHE